MPKHKKLPTGLFHRKRRDGTYSDVLWCFYYTKGSTQPTKESTGTTDVDEAKRFRASRMAEHPTARLERLTRQKVTTADALALYEADARDHGRRLHRGRIAALRHALGAVPLAELTRARLDELTRTWRTAGVEYPDRDTTLHRVRPITGASCNRMLATLRRARTLAMDKLGVDLPRLTFPRFREEPAGRYVAPADFYAILAHVEHPTKRAFVELLYLLGVRPGQLKSTETSNVRLEKGIPAALVYKPAQVKQRTPHEVPLVGRAQDIVRDLWRSRQLGCRLLFHVNEKPLRELKTEWRRAVEAAGIDGLKAGRKGGGVVLYNLRHSCLTNLAAAGVPDSTARAISGHKTDSAHRRYVITQATAKVAALEAMSRAVAEAARS
jgi:integrase